MKIFINVILWIISIFLLFCSIALLVTPDTKSLGVFFFIWGLSIVPPINTFINKKLSLGLEILSTNINNSKFKDNFILKFTILDYILNSKNTKRIGIIKFLIFLILFCFAVENTSISDTKISDTNNTLNKQEMQENKYLNNKNTKKIAKATKLNKNLSSKSYEILVNCGVSEISWIEKIDDIDNAYFIHLDNISEPIKVSFKNNAVEYVIFGTWDLYNNGKYNGKLSDYSVTLNEEIQLKRMSKDSIDANLKYPKNAKYDLNSWKITKLNNQYGVSCNVEAPNAFGMYSNYIFFLSYLKDNGEFNLNLIQINGEKGFEQKQTSKLNKMTKKDEQTVKDINKALGL